MDKVKVGIIGIGNMGTTHAHNIFEGKIPKMELCAICDVKEERRAYARENFKDVAVFENSTEMFKSELINMVIIAVPHYDHPSLAIEAFSFGINVLVEKPAGVYTKQVMEMNEAAEKSGLLFGIMYNQRTNPAYQKLRAMIQSGELGHIKRVSWVITDWYRCQRYHDSAAWRSRWETEGGGTLINQNPHQLDLWQWMFGMPDRIMSHCYFGKYYNIEVEDDVTAFFEYDNGMTGTYITSTGETPGENRLEVSCDMGLVIIKDNKIEFKRNVMSERIFNEKSFELSFGRPEYWECIIPLSGDDGEQHIGILKNYAEALLEGKELLAPGEEGIKGLTISNAIHYSTWSKSWVDLKNFPHDKFYNILQDKINNSTITKSVNELISRV